MAGLVSVIIPCYNAVSTLERAVQSVLGQTYQNFEIIIIDDCSTDETLEIIHHFSDPRIRYLQNEQNLKSGLTRNVGIEHAKGDYIAFLDADDAWHQDKLEKDLFILNAYPQFDVVCNEFISEAWYGKKEIRQKPLKTKEITVKKILFKTSMSTSTVTLRNNFSERFPKYIHIAEDLYFWVLLLIGGHRVVKTNQVATYYNNGYHYRLSLNFKMQHHNEIQVTKYAYAQKAINGVEYWFYRFLYFLKLIRRPFKFMYLAAKEKMLYRRVKKAA